MKRMFLQDRTWTPKSVPHAHILYLWDIAHIVSNRTGHDVEDLFSEACYGYLKHRNEWNPKRGKFTTFLYLKIQQHLMYYLWKFWAVNREVKGHKIQFVPYEHVESLILAEAAKGQPVPFKTVSV